MPDISNDTVYAKAVARSWSDSVFRTQLLSDPKKVLTAEGMSIPDWMDVSVTENRSQSSSAVFYLPPKPETLSTSSLTDAAFRAATKYAASDTDASKCSDPNKCHANDPGAPAKCHTDDTGTDTGKCSGKCKTDADPEPGFCTTPHKCGTDSEAEPAKCVGKCKTDADPEYEKCTPPKCTK